MNFSGTVASHPLRSVAFGPMLALPLAATAFSRSSVQRPRRSALRMQLVPVESNEKVKMNSFGIMQRRLGDTDLLVSECCLGGMTWGDQNTVDDAVTQLNFAFDNGVALCRKLRPPRLSQNWVEQESPGDA